jgi:hypothetical protein
MKDPAVWYREKQIQQVIKRNNSISKFFSFPIPEMATDDNTDIPFDILREILSYLPIEEIFNLRMVCKSWRTVLTDNRFWESKAMILVPFMSLENSSIFQEKHWASYYALLRSFPQSLTLELSQKSNTGDTDHEIPPTTKNVPYSELRDRLFPNGTVGRYL